MADCISVRPNHNNFPVDASNRLFKAQTMQPGMFFLIGDRRVAANHKRANTELHFTPLFSGIDTNLIDQHFCFIHWPPVNEIYIG